MRLSANVAIAIQASLVIPNLSRFSIAVHFRHRATDAPNILAKRMTLSGCGSPHLGHRLVTSLWVDCDSVLIGETHLLLAQLDHRCSQKAAPTKPRYAHTQDSASRS